VLKTLSQVDPEIYNWIKKEEEREKSNLILIASENYTSPAVREAQGSVLTHKYAEGYPGRRYYGGCEFIDEIEKLAIKRAKELFSAPPCECATSLRFSGKYGYLFSTFKARRCNSGNGYFLWWSSDSWT